MTMPVTPPAAEAQPQDDLARRSVDLPDELIAAVALGVVGLGLAGAVALRRRRRHEAELYDEVYETEPQFVAEAPVTSIPDELAVGSAEPAIAPAAQPVAIPAGPVPTGEARQRLLDEMTAAAPDEANPFTSSKARRKRARIILQAREHEQSTEPFDWRTYRSPAVHDPAHPAKVDA
jgi:hypothetical protein